MIADRTDGIDGILGGKKWETIWNWIADTKTNPQDTIESIK